MSTASFFRYWGKADPAYPAEPKWHPLVYHCVDVAAVGIEYLCRTPSVRTLLMRELRIEDERTLEHWMAFWFALDGIDCWMRAVTGPHGQPPKESGEFWEQHFDRKQDRAAILEFVAEIRSLLVGNGVAAIPSGSKSAIAES